MKNNKTIVMQKRINILSTVLLLAILFGLVSHCQVGTSEFMRGVREGYYEEMAREQCHSSSSVLLLPKNHTDAFKDSLYCSATGSYLPVCIESASVAVETEGKYRCAAVEYVSYVLIILAALFWIWLFLAFISKIKKGEIFSRANEKLLSLMGIVFVSIYALTWIGNRVYKFNMSRILALDNYKVVVDVPSTYSLAVGIGFLILSTVFTMGRKMKEDQEYMV